MNSTTLKKMQKIMTTSPKPKPMTQLKKLAPKLSIEQRDYGIHSSWSQRDTPML